MINNKPRDNHKYIARVHMKTVRGRKIYRYFYDKEEYQAYLKSRTPNKNDAAKQPSDEQLSEKTTTQKDKKKNEKKSFLGKLGDAIKDVVDSGKKFVEKACKTADKVSASMSSAGKKFIDKISNVLDKTASTVREVTDTATETGKKFVDKYVLRKPQLKEKKFTKDEDMKVVNPKYDPTDYGTSQNCAYCTAAYDLRRRGYDVEAIEKSMLTDAGITLPGKEHLVTTAESIISWYENADQTSFEEICDKYEITKDVLWSKEYLTYQEIYDITLEELSYCIEDDLREQGEGSYGHFFLYWSAGGGHDVVWSVENNEVVIRDTQTNEKHKIIDLIQYCDDFSYFRSDNLEINERIWDVVKNR